MTDDKVSIKFFLTRELKEKAEAQAKAEDESLSRWLRELIKKELDNKPKGE